MKKLSILALILLTTIALPMVAVQFKANATDLTALIVDTIGEPMDADPAWSYDTGSAEMLMNMYETLLWFNRTNMDSYVPVLASSWTPEIIDFTDPTTGLHFVFRWTFTLDTTPHYFHYVDGTYPGEGAQVTADDIEYSFHRILVADAATGPVWMIWEPLTGGYSAWDLNASLPGPYDVYDPVYDEYWSTYMDEAIDLLCESNSTHVWFNLAMTYEPFLQIVAQQWGSILNRAWCTWHGDWNGNIDNGWINYHDLATSPLYDAGYAPAVNNLDCALGSGPYMFDYWIKGVGGSWSVKKNPAYYRGWTTPYNPTGWGAAPPGGWIQGHVDSYTSNYIPEWTTRKLRFLGGASDFCAVPRMYMAQVLGQPGIDCIFPLPNLACDGAFFTYNVSMSSTRMGSIKGPGQWVDEFGAPCNMFNDKNARLGFAHLFDYETYLYSAFLNEGIAPVTPIVPGLAYYDSSIGVAEQPVPDLRKQYGITGEPAGQLAYDLALAKTYLQAAWGGALWSTGFTMDLMYNEGNLPRLTAAQLIKDGLDYMNANYGTRFHANIKSIPWSVYKIEWRARSLPYFIVGWLADYPDAHNFVHPFMHSTGAFSRWQGVKGDTNFPNQAVDDHIEDGIDTIVPAERQGNYTWLQQYYVDEAPGLTLLQPTGRHFERDWVEGWYYNPIYPGNYAWDFWKKIAGTVENVDVAITSMTTVSCFEIGLPIPDNVMTVFPTVDVDVARLDANGAVPNVLVIIGFGLRNATGYEIIIGTDQATLGIGGTYTATFDNFVQDTSYPVEPGTYTTFAVVLVMSGYASDSNMANNMVNNSVVNADTMLGDINVDGYVELGDFFLESQAFGSYPGHPRWDTRCDLNTDAYVELSDFFILSQHFGEIYCP